MSRGTRTTLPLPDEEELDTIHVYPVEGGGILLTRTRLNRRKQHHPSLTARTITPTEQQHKHRPLFVLFLLLLCLFVLGDLADTQLIALMTPTATITITPDVRTITLQSTATTGQAVISSHLDRVPNRPDHGTRPPGRPARNGTLTLYNGAFQSVTVAAGTVVTGTDGIRSPSTQEAVIPASDPTTTPADLRTNHRCRASSTSGSQWATLPRLT